LRRKMPASMTKAHARATPSRLVPSASVEEGRGKDTKEKKRAGDHGHAQEIAGVLGRAVLLVLLGLSLFSLWRGQAAKREGALVRDADMSARATHEFLRDRLCPGLRPDVDAARELFARGQELLGVDGGVDRRVRARDVPAKWFSFAPGAFTLPSKRAVFFYTWKCGSHASRKFLKELAASLAERGVEGVPVEGTGDPAAGTPGERGEVSRWKGWGCKVMVTREPLGHFTSGANEWEYRAARAGDDTLKEPRFLDAHRDQMAFARAPLGDSRRFDLFVADLLRPGSLLMDAPGIEHTFPTAGVLTRLSPPKPSSRGGSVAGRYPRRSAQQGSSTARTVAAPPALDVRHVDVANLTFGLPEAFRGCPSVPAARVPPAVPELPDGGHASNKDPHGTYLAAREAIKKSFAGEGPATAKALCLALALDYACFDYPWPSGCDTLVEDALLDMDH